MKCDLDAEVRRYEKKMGLGPVDPRDRELAVLRAQVRVLAERAKMRCVGCPAWRSGCTYAACNTNLTEWSRQQAEKEVGL